MEKREKKEQTNAPKKETSKATLIAALAVIVIIVGYYGVLYLPDVFAAPKFEKNKKSFVYTSYGDVDKTIAVPIDTLGYTKNDVIAFFDEVALRIESGGSSCISKWESPIKLFVHGEPSNQDLSVLSTLLASLNNLSSFPGIELSPDKESANSFIYFLTKDDYHQLERQYGIVSSNGFASKEKSNDSVILKTTIGINCELHQHYRLGVIIEELLQSLGLYNDSWKYDYSIFYQGVNELESPADIDWLLVELLYHPAVRIGTGRSECLFVLRNLLVS